MDGVVNLIYIFCSIDYMSINDTYELLKKHEILEYIPVILNHAHLDLSLDSLINLINLFSIFCNYELKVS